MRDFISCLDCSPGEYCELARLTERFAGECGGSSLRGKVVGLALFSPSTRTRLGCAAAVKRLGGDCLDLGEKSSVLKGEDLEDTVTTFGQYVDALVIRHPDENAAGRAADLVKIPVINGGDGRNELPMGGLLLFYQVFRWAKAMGKEMSTVRILFYGPLKYSRACHSLMPVLALFGVRMFVDCPAGLGLPVDYAKWVQSKGGVIVDARMRDALPEIDVLVATTVEEHKSSYGSEEYRDVVRFYDPITRDTVARMRKDAIVMTIPPRSWEVSKEVDRDDRAVYMRLAADGLHTKMALFHALLSA